MTTTTIADIVSCLESVAPRSLQEDYDNAGLLAGNPAWPCTGILCTLDVTEEVVQEAAAKNCNAIVAHHPLIFKGIKKLSGGSGVERALIAAIKNDVAIYAAHTNLDNIARGVNGRIADLLGLENRRVLAPRPSVLRKLYTFVPASHFSSVQEALFRAGAGQISEYSECSFSHPGTGTFRPGEGTQPFLGTPGQRQEETELKLEVILPFYREAAVLSALFAAHPYEEVAYDLVALQNTHAETGAGLIGEIAELPGRAFLDRLLRLFGVGVVRHTALPQTPVKRVAVCGGAGSFLISNALSMGADAYVTADLKYHEFFAAEGRMLLCDIGHYESEQFTTALLADILLQKFPTIAVLKSETTTNPVHYFTGK